MTETAGNVSGSARLNLRASAEGRVISNFALTYFNAARHFSRKVQEIEEAHKGNAFGNFFEEISTYGSACIISSAAALEALINELFLHPGGPLRDAIGKLDPFDLYWDHRPTEGRGTIEKYIEALKLFGDGYPQGLQIRKDADALVRLRNYFIHFKPNWDTDETPSDLEGVLRGRFSLCPYVDDTSDFFAMQCMSAGCAAWCVNTARDFIGDFHNRTKVFEEKLRPFLN